MYIYNGINMVELGRTLSEESDALSKDDHINTWIRSTNPNSYTSKVNRKIKEFTLYWKKLGS